MRSTEECLFVIGASAGGIDALVRLLPTLPADFAAPIVIAQHLDPAQPSRLEEILRRATPLKVVMLAKEARLERGTVYLVPSGRHVEITDEHVFLSRKLRHARPQPSIDLLFQTAAEAYGERLVAVILSGTGSDGAAGVRTVKEAGGTVVVQDPATAAYAALPAAIPPNQIDVVTPLETMGPLLANMAANKDVPEAFGDEDMVRAFLSQVRAQSGIDFTQYKMPTILRRLSRLMSATRCATLPEYMRYLNSHPDAYQHLVGTFLIKVTGFFRDPVFYKYLREEVLPDIIKRAREYRTDLRVWSAGCATGEEAYSIAMLLTELLGDSAAEFNIRIFATDLDTDSIVFARRGLYTAAAVANVPPEMLSRYFTKIDDAYQIRKHVRNLTVFGEYDLGQRAPFPRIDLILCRNVLIYFTKDLQQRTLQLFAFSLREGGYLALGKAESIAPLPQYFVAVHPTLKLFRRQGERLLIPAPAFVDGGTAKERPALRRSQLRMSAASRRTADAAMHPTLPERLGSMLMEAPLGMVLVDRNYDIEAINQSARMMLGILGPGIGEDLIHLTAAVAGNGLKNALDNVFRREESSAECEISVLDEAEDAAHVLRVTCFADRPAHEGHINRAAVVIADDSKNARHREELEERTGTQQKEVERLMRLTEFLQERQRSLLEANAELTSANNDLRNTNEHLMIAAEEAEASAEEVETLNEEMQATSEELETLNEELQATVEELHTTNEELGARGSDLEKAAALLDHQLKESEHQRDLFERAFDGIEKPMAVLTADGEILAASEGYRALANRHSTLRAVGERWVAPSGKELHVRELATADGVGRLIQLSEQ